MKAQPRLAVAVGIEKIGGQSGPTGRVEYLNVVRQAVSFDLRGVVVAVGVGVGEGTAVAVGEGVGVGVAVGVARAAPTLPPPPKPPPTDVAVPGCVDRADAPVTDTCNGEATATCP